jgi:hypothetical protein
MGKCEQQSMIAQIAWKSIDRGEDRMVSRICKKSLGSLAKLGVKAALMAFIISVVWMSGCGGSHRPVAIQVAPGTTNIAVGQSQTFTATVTNTGNTAVMWAVQEGAAGGSITAAGVYTAPMKAGSYHVIAASAFDPTKTAAASITATAPAPSFTSTAPAVAAEDVAYTYTITATDPVNTPITYAVKSGPTGGTISNNVLSWTPTHGQSRVSNQFDVTATTDAGGTADQQFTITPTGVIRGTAIDNYFTANGTVKQPEDLSHSYIGISYVDGTAWNTVQGVGKADGTFTILGVPAGNYWLAIASGGYWTSASDLDLGQNFLGRPDAVNATSGSSMSLQFAGLSPFGENDELEIFNPNLVQNVDWTANLNIGDTTFSTMWSWDGPLSAASKGDAWYVLQDQASTVGNITWHTLARATPAINFTQTDNGESNMVGELVVAPTTTVHVAAKGSQFAAALPNIGNAATVHSATIGIYAQPFSAAGGSLGQAEDLLETQDQTPITEDVDFGDMAVANPFPASWTPYVAGTWEINVPFTATGATGAVQYPAELYVSSTQIPTKDAPLAPQITPVLNVQLNGAAFAQYGTVPTLSPKLSWDVPSTGTPTGYRISIYHLSSAQTQSYYQQVIDLFTKDHTFTIPAGILTAGNEYFFVVRVYLAPSVDFTTAPYRGAFPWAHADTVTPVISTTGAPSITINGTPNALQHVLQRPANAPVAGSPARLGMHRKNPTAQ